MFCRNIEQVSFLDKFDSMPQYLKDILIKSWAHSFNKFIFPFINEKRFAVLYSTNYASRPNTPVNIIIGLLIIKEMLQLTDEELIGSLHFDTRFQYALGTLNYEKQPVSINTLYNFRTRLLEYYNKTSIDLLKDEVEAQAKMIEEKLSIDGKMIRMDSLMVSASCRKLSRIELVYSVNYRFIKMLNSESPELLPNDFKVYLEKGHKNDTIYRTRDIETESKLLFLLKQSKTLYEIGLNSNSTITTAEEFKQLERLLKDQTTEDEAGQIQSKAGKNISSESIQNPTDPDATFRTKYGPNVGYTANVVEAFDDKNSVISTYDFQPNIYSDSQFADDIIEKLGSEAIEESEKISVIIDGAYYEQEKAQEALAKGIELIPSNLVGKKPSTEKLSYSGFKIDTEKKVISECPNGIKPEESYYSEKTYTAKFDPSQCENCPLNSQCPFKKQKKHNVIRVSEKRYNTDLQREKMGTEEYIKLTNKRAGIEGIPSVLRRRYRVDSIPVRGLVRSKIWFGFMIAAYNVKKLLNWLKKVPVPLILKQINLIFYLLSIIHRQNIFILENLNLSKVLFVP